MAPLAPVALPAWASSFGNGSANGIPFQSRPPAAVEWPHLAPNSWDTHVHVFAPQTYPYSPQRQYTPSAASPAKLLAFNANLTAAAEGAAAAPSGSTGQQSNIVLVQPSPYGTDNSLLLDLLRNHSASSGQTSLLRAVAVIDPEAVEDVQLREMHALGVRGVRINTEQADRDSYSLLRAAIVAAAERVAAVQGGWNCQLYTSGESWDHIADVVRTLPVPVIADHQGGMAGLTKLAAANGSADVTAQPGFASLLALAKSGNVFIKVSALYRSSKLTGGGGGYEDVEPLIKTFAREVPQQLLWGSDWPHTLSNRSNATRWRPEGFRKVDDEAVVSDVRAWVGEEVWESMTVGTPARLYV